MMHGKLDLRGLFQSSECSKSQALKPIEKNNIHQEEVKKKMKDRNHVHFGVPREVLGIPDLQHLGVCLLSKAKVDRSQTKLITIAK